MSHLTLVPPSPQPVYGQKWQWTRELVIEQLQDAAFVLDKVPTLDEARAVVKLPSGGKIAELFGSYHEALVAAGLTSAPARRRKRRWSREAVIVALQELAVVLGHSPSQRDAARTGSLIYPSVVQFYFGTWNNGLRAAGLEVREPCRPDLPVAA